MRISGTVQWFSEVKGFGFITPHAKGNDVFVHRSALPPDLAVLQKDDIVEFEVKPGPQGRPGASGVLLVSRAATAEVR